MKASKSSSEQPPSLVNVFQDQPAIDKFGTALGLVSLLVTLVVSFTTLSEIADPSQSRASILGVFSSVYLLTTYVSRVDFSSFTKRSGGGKLVGLSAPAKTLDDGGALAPADYTEEPKPTYIFGGGTISIDSNLVNAAANSFGVEASFSLVGHVKEQGEWHLILCGTAATVSTLQFPPASAILPLQVNPLGFLSKYISPMNPLTTGEAERRAKDRSLHSTITNKLLLVASLLAIPYPNRFRDSRFASLIAETYLPVFKNVPDKVELEHCVAVGSECVVVIPCSVVRSDDVVVPSDGKSFEVDKVVAVFGVGEEKFFSPLDIKRLQFLCANAIVSAS